MKKTHKISRKKFLKWIGFILLVPFSYLLNLVIKKQIEKESRKKKIKIPSGLPEGLTLVDDVIVSKNGNDLIVYSSKCTHLGCELKTIDAGLLVCQCHGSRFDSFGKPVNGPASKNLIQLPVQVDSKTGELFVYA